MKLTSINLFIFQLIAHILTIYWFFSEYFTFINIFYVFLVYFFTGCIGMSITYHRLLTHRSFKTNKIFEYIGTMLATIGLTGSSITWTATHRQHHVYTDKVNDPHSPTVLGYIKSQWFSMFSSIEIKRSSLLRDKFHIFMHRHYISINLLYGIILFIIGGFYAVLTFWLVPACVLWNAGSMINTISHTKILGYRNYNTNDNSVNNFLLGYLMWGEGWHNNHHKNQKNENFSVKWWEFDISYRIIKLIRIKNVVNK